MSKGIRSFLFVAVSCTAFAQPVVVRFSRVVDLRAVLKNHTGREDFAIMDIAQRDGYWVAVASFKGAKESIAIRGDHTDKLQLSELITGRVARVALGGQGQVILSFQPDYLRSATEIETRDFQLRKIARQSVKVVGIEPLIAGSQVFWRHRGLLYTIVGNPVLSGRLRPVNEDPPWTPPEYEAQREFIFSASGADGATRWIKFGSLSEESEVRDNNGYLLTKATVALDDAYRSGGLPIAKRNLFNGVSRVHWAVASLDGDLYVCLSGLPSRGPAHIGVFDPHTGMFKRLIAAERPVSPLRVSKHVPTGTMFPGAGAMGDRLVIIDIPIGLVAIY